MKIESLFCIIINFTLFKENASAIMGALASKRKRDVRRE